MCQFVTTHISVDRLSLDAEFRLNNIGVQGLRFYGTGLTPASLKMEAAYRPKRCYLRVSTRLHIITS